ncbi:hypothetical protein PMAYCL1PPCAC_04213, partial [Pristionchus mayeri]
LILACVLLMAATTALAAPHIAGARHEATHKHHDKLVHEMISEAEADEKIRVCGRHLMILIENADEELTCDEAPRIYVRPGRRVHFTRLCCENKCTKREIKSVLCELEESNKI